ncbi:MAG: hypothetical protein CME62_00720 [Halobacteriovoraceae bacterium]|nr:hypothetical protein [Halobacteriovoraceae bacterium]|tara:strand:+ start:16232 stop:16900 length:669 start_codon:yes stop_codon:yes gene_type:complete
MNIKIIADIIAIIFSYLPVFLTYFIVLFSFSYQVGQENYVMAFLSLIAIIPVFFALIFFFRLFIPKMKPGVYSAGLNKGFAAWFFNLALNRAIRISQLQELIFSSYILKFIYWRIMGAKISFGINSSMYVDFVDLPLITIEPDCSITDKVHIAGHTFTGDKLLLGRVHIKKNSFIGMNCVIGPRSTIGENCYIGLNNRIFRENIADGSKIDNFEWEYGKPKA